MKYKPFIIALALFIFAVSVQAQSGRRQTKPIPAAPVPTPTPEPTPTPKKDDKPPELIFLVAKNMHTLGNVPLAYHSAAQRGCADRLRARSNADVDAPDRDLNRSEASNKAKSSTNTYVVLLTLAIDSMARSYDDLQLDYVMFAPQTGKVVTTGRSYVNGNRTGPIVVGRAPGGLYMEQSLRKAGEEVADRVLKKLNMVIK